MKHHTSLCLSLVTMLVVTALLSSEAHAWPKPGERAPDFKVVTTSGEAVSLETYRGKVLVIDFFATWCPPCKTSIPFLAGMNSKYGKKGLQILGQSLDEDEGELKAYARKHGITYPVALLPEEVQGDYGVVSLPVIYVIDKKGTIAEIYRGFSDETGPSMERLIKKLLARK